jgi:hypothetical protein
MTNDEIVDSFLNRKPAAGPISSNGKELMTNGTKIAEWNEDGSGIVMPNASQFISIAATKHRNTVRRLAIIKGIKVTQIN